MNYDFVQTKYSVEIKDSDISNLKLTKQWQDELEMALGKKERLLREQIRFYESLGDIEVSYEGDLINIEVISENAAKIALKIDTLICQYNTALNDLPRAYQGLTELELMLA